MIWVGMLCGAKGVKRDVFVGLVKCIRLLLSEFIDIGIYARTLNDAQSIVIGFPMPDDIHCFCGLGG
ncbi:MAG: hypothetical protein RLZZ47_1252 [Bacteroidota bacterium]